MTNTDVYPDAGLRISTIEPNRFAINVMPHGVGRDVAIDAHGARVYLDQDAAQALDRAVLDAEGDSWSADQFTLEPV
jgi:hypothetical protein